MHMVRQTIQDGTGKAFGAEDFGPFIEWQIGRDDDRAALIANISCRLSEQRPRPDAICPPLWVDLGGSLRQF